MGVDVRTQQAWMKVGNPVFFCHVYVYMILLPRNPSTQLLKKQKCCHNNNKKVRKQNRRWVIAGWFLRHGEPSGKAFQDGLVKRSSRVSIFYEIKEVRKKIWENRRLVFLELCWSSRCCTQMGKTPWGRREQTHEVSKIGQLISWSKKAYVV